MIFKSRNKALITGDIEYDYIPQRKLIFIEKITIYERDDRKKGKGSLMLYKLLEQLSENKDIRGFNIVGISTPDASGFWETMGALFSNEREESGDMFFNLRGVDLFIYIRNKFEKKNELLREIW